MNLTPTKKSYYANTSIPFTYEALESVMCDVIKKRLKRGMRGEVGKETPKKEVLDVFYDVTHDTLQRFIYL